MRLAVLDTNVIVSAGVKPDGIPRLVVERMLLGEAHIVTCPGVLDEYIDVMQRAKFTRYTFPPPWLGSLIEESIHVPDPEPWPYALPDPDDRIFIALAHASGAPLITGNLRHFPPSARGGVKVLSPADYLAQLTGS
ncbi:MAG TPA: putative toxin-antitoxin system toxin component, PIN family [Acidobacteriaceae bacterium]|nr:putative toxin-antitoxin system toxin component, PIN family [Acidobacteriaceae bacterium]